MQNNCIFQNKTKNLVRRGTLFYIIINHFNVCLVSHICFSIKSVGICCFGWSIWRQFGLTQMYVVGKERSILIAFSNNCGYSSLILPQNPSSGRFLKFSCNMGSETISMNFFYLVTLKSVHALVIWKISVHWIIQIFQVLAHFIIQYKKNHIC